MVGCPASYFHFLWYVSFLKVAFWLWSNGRAKVTECEAVAAGKENQYNGGERQATSIKHGEMWETGKKEEDVIFWETRKWAPCSSISIYGIRIVNIAGDIWYWDEEICVRPFSFKPLSLHGLLLFKEATMEKEGSGEKKGFCCSISQTIFPVRLSQVSSTVHDPSLPFPPQLIQHPKFRITATHLSLQPCQYLLYPPFFPRERVSPSLGAAVSTGFQFLATHL